MAQSVITEAPSVSVTSLELTNRNIFSSVNDDPPPNVEQFDFCLVFPTKDDVTADISSYAFEITERILLAFGRKYVYQYTSLDRTHRYVLIRGGLGKMKAKATTMGYLLPLDESVIRDETYRGDVSNNIQPFDIPHRPDHSRFDPYSFIFGRYRPEPEFESLYWRPRGMTHPFTREVRLDLIHRIFSDSLADGGVSVDLEYLKKEGTLVTYFPLHSIQELYSLENKWVTWGLLTGEQPLNDVKSYFGVKITYFFCLVDHVGSWLFGPAIVGIAFEVVQIYFTDFKYTPQILSYALFIMFWGVFLLRMWRRRERFMAMQWMAQPEAPVKPEPKTRVRFEYNGIEEISYITGKPERLERSFRFSPWVPYTFNILLLTVIVALASVISLYVLKAQLLVSAGFSGWEVQWIISAITAVQILMSNSLYYRLAVALTHLENYFTDIDFEKALIVKVFTLQFVNSYASFYYLAFATLYISNSTSSSSTSFFSVCTRDTCMNILAMNLITVCATRALAKPTIAFLLPCMLLKLQTLAQSLNSCLTNLCIHGICCMQISPYCTCCGCSSPAPTEQLDGNEGLNMWSLYPFRGGYSGGDDEGKDNQSTVSAAAIPVDSHEAEIEGHQTEFDQIVDLNQSYVDLVISLGYLVLFGCILPILGLSFMLELGYAYRCQAWRLIKYYRRPSAQEDGTGSNTHLKRSTFEAWYQVLYALTSASIATNAGLISFTIGMFESWGALDRVWLFLGIQLFMFCFRYGLNRVVPDEPREVTIQLARSQHIASKVIDKIPDANFDATLLL